MSNRLTRRSLLARTSVTAAALATSGGLLEACARGSTQGATASPPASPLPITKEKITLNFLGLAGDNEQKTYQALADSFTQKYPNITVALSNAANSATDTQARVVAALASGTPPDVIWTHTYITPGLASAQALLPLDQFIHAENYDLGAFLPSPVKDFNVGGKQYGLPRETTAFVMWYNVDLLNQAGAPMPPDGWTWKDLSAAAAQAQRPKDGVYGITGMTNDIYMQLIKTWQNGGDILDDQRQHYTLDQNPGLQAAQFIADMVWGSKLHPAAGTPGTGNLFATGKAVFQPLYSTFSSMLNATFRWDVAPIPTDGKRTTRVASAGHAIVASTKHPNEAWLLLKHLESQEAFELYAQSLAMPSHRSVFEEAMAGKNPHILVPKSVQVIRDAFDYGRPEPIAGNWGKVHSSVTAALASVWGPQHQDPKVALTSVAPDVEQWIRAKPS